MNRSDYIRLCTSIIGAIGASLAFGIFGSTALAAPLLIIYPRSFSETDTRAGYYIKLLDLALSKTGVQYALRPNEFQMVGQRMLQKLEMNDGIDVTWGPTTRDYERRLLPIRISLDKGILGWRLFLINARDRHLFEGIDSIKQLQKYSAGQQREWADTTILRTNGLPVVDTTSYEYLFGMLAAGRFQYFPRGVGEIWDEQKSHAHLDQVVEEHLALHYPAYTYFFVSKSNTTLARLIEQGLRAAKKDGSFDKLFDQYNGESVKRAHLDTRTVFELNNPLLPTIPPQPERENLRPH
jgi:hypothetical protein